MATLYIMAISELKKAVKNCNNMRERMSYRDSVPYDHTYSTGILIYFSHTLHLTTFCVIHQVMEFIIMSHPFLISKINNDKAL
jgi:acyl-CoA thioesterase